MMPRILLAITFPMMFTEIWASNGRLAFEEILLIKSNDGNHFYSAFLKQSCGFGVRARCPVTTVLGRSNNDNRYNGHLVEMMCQPTLT